MKKAVLVLVICVSALLTGYSQTKQESIKELFQLMQKDSVINRSISPILSMLKTMQLKDSTLSVESRNSIISNLQNLKELSIKMQNEEMALYDKYYTQDEITYLIKFYKSSLGQKSIESNESIQNDLKLIVQQKYMSEIGGIITSMQQIKYGERTIK